MKTLYKYLGTGFLLFLLRMSSNTLMAQNLSFNIENISVDHQLNNNPITAIIQDSDGFILFGTRNGIFRYDGISSRQIFFSHTNRLTNQINCFYNDKKNNIWIGTNSELIMWNKEKRIFVVYDLQSIAKTKLTYTSYPVKILDRFRVCSEFVNFFIY